MDLLPGLACFLGCLFYELEMGIGLGVVIQVLMLLYHAARPGVEVTIKKVSDQSMNRMKILSPIRYLTILKSIFV